MTKEQFFDSYRNRKQTAVPVYNGQDRGLMFVHEDGYIVCKYHGDYLVIKDEDFKKWELKQFDPEDRQP